MIEFCTGENPVIYRDWDFTTSMGNWGLRFDDEDFEFGGLYDNIYIIGTSLSTITTDPELMDLEQVVSLYIHPVGMDRWGSRISELKNMTNVHIGANDITPIISEEEIQTVVINGIFKLPKLKTLRMGTLSLPHLENTGPHRLPSLETLVLYGINHSLPIEVPNLKNISLIREKSFEINDPVRLPQWIYTTTQLTTLDLSIDSRVSNVGIAPEDLIILVETQPLFESLTLRRGTSIYQSPPDVIQRLEEELTTFVYNP